MKDIKKIESEDVTAPVQSKDSDFFQNRHEFIPVYDGIDQCAHMTSVGHCGARSDNPVHFFVVGFGKSNRGNRDGINN